MASTSGDLTSSSYVEETVMSKDVGLLDIPQEILDMIFSYCTRKDLLNLRLTCTTFQERASHPSLLCLDMIDRKYSLYGFSTLMQLMKRLMPNIVALHLTGDHLNCVNKEFIGRLLDNCGRLQTLFLESCQVDGGASIAQLPNTLSILTLSDVIFETPESFFKVTGDNSLLELKIKIGRNVESPAVFEGIATFANLNTLHLDGIKKLTDETFVKFHGHLANLIELHLINLPVGDQAFHTIGKSFRKLTELRVKQLKVSGDGFVALKGNVLLENLIVEDCLITDASVRSVLDRLVNLKRIAFESCPIEDLTMNAICQGLPNLESLEIIHTYSSMPRITDMGIGNIINHMHLHRLSLNCVILSDSGIMELVPKLPNLTWLDVSTCCISDLGFQAITETLHGLATLKLLGTRITNDGLARNLPRLTALTNVTIVSENINECGVLPIIAFLTSTIFTELVFVNNRNDCRLSVSQIPQHRYLDCVKFSWPAVERIFAAFPNCPTVRLTDITLTAANVEFLYDCHPNLEKLSMYQARTTDDIAEAILLRFSRLTALHIYNTCVTDATFLNIDALCKETALRDLSIQSGIFPSEDTIVTVAPILCAMRFFNVWTKCTTNQIALEWPGNPKRLILTGSCITNSILLAFVSGIQGLCELTIDRTSVTLAGLREVAPFLTELEGLKLDLSTSMDVQHLSGDAAAVLAELVTTNLKEVSIQGKSFVGADLAELVLLFDTLKRLQGIRSLITLDWSSAE